MLPKPEPPDTTTREGAEALARKLDAYWHAQGFPQVQHWVEMHRRLTPAAPLHGEAMWVVRSNLVRGLPPPSVRREAT
jgi:hypothetical protein